MSLVGCGGGLFGVLRYSMTRFARLAEAQ